MTYQQESHEADSMMLQQGWRIKSVKYFEIIKADGLRSHLEVVEYNK